MLDMPFSGVARLELIGREKEKELINLAMSQRNRLRVVYFKGLGGIGKTSLLQYITRLFSTSDNPDYLYSGLIDLYDYDNHSASSLEDVVLNGLMNDFNRPRSTPLPDYLRSAILDYQRRSKELEERRFALPSIGELVERERQALSQYFLRTFHQIEKVCRPVICFDTIELLQHETDSVQRKLPQLLDENTSVKHWLCETISQMSNALIVLAGRPETEPDKQLWLETLLYETLLEHQSKLGPVEELLTVVNLEGLQPVEIATYLSQARPDFFEGDLPEIKSSYIKNVATLTGGKPIMLGWFAELCDQLPWAEIGQKSGEELGALIDQFEEAIIGQIQSGRGLTEEEREARRAIEFLIWARKGLQAEMLAFMLQRSSFDPERYTPETCQIYLDRLRDLSFVKVRESRQLFFLHDEIYRILSSSQRGSQTSEEIYSLLYKYHSYELERNVRQDAELRSKPEWYADLQALDIALHLEQQRQKYLTERLYYLLCLDLRSGYDMYSRLTDIALMASQFEMDERMRDEFLRLLDEGEGWRRQALSEREISPSLLERDDALRWLKRLSAQGRSHTLKAQRLETALRSQKSSNTPTSEAEWEPETRATKLTPEKLGFSFEYLDDPFFQADLLMTVWQTSVLLTRGSEELINRLQVAIEALEQQETKDIQFLPPIGDLSFVTYREWLYYSVLGRAYNNLGYTYRLRRHLPQAERAYRRALPYLSQVSQMEAQRADTMNNLAYVYRLEGKLIEARVLCLDALRQREFLGHGYFIALSRNTLGLIYLSQDRYDWALRECRAARKLMERAAGSNANRGAGLVYVALGKTLRRSGHRLYDESIIREAIDYLTNATTIFDELREPVSQVEAYNELGCAYRSLGIVESRTRGFPILKLYERAVQHLEHSVALCGKELILEKADCFEDIAQVYYRQSDDDKAFQYLERADDQIDLAYRYNTEDRLPPATEETMPECFTNLGKADQLRGDIYFRQHFKGERGPEGLEKAIECYIRCIGYYEHFSPEVEQVRVALAKIYFRLEEQIRKPGGYIKTQQDRQLILQYLIHYRERYFLHDSPTLRRLFELMGHH
ncbi:MAG: tetratricopeptide repeat protein [Chloroflexi bacterium]|nr:tetratricopeptide repeat protein [Chloroflexota bacterium]